MRPFRACHTNGACQARGLAPEGKRFYPYINAAAAKSPLQYHLRKNVCNKMQSPSTENTSPEKTSKISKAALIVPLVFAVLLAVGLVAPMPFGGRTYGVIFDMLHGPAFALFAAILVFVLPKRTTRQKLLVVVGVWFFLVGGGVLAEIIQSFIGRSASWHDIAANTLGVTAGLLWATTRGTQSRPLRGWATAVSILLLMAAAARAPFILTDCLMQRFDKPILASFESRLEMTRWKTHDCRISRASDHATHGQSSLRMDLDEAVYPGIASRSLLHDWSDYEALAFDITVDEGPPLELVIKLQDALHDCDPSDRFEKIFRLGPGTHAIEIPLAAVAQAPRDRALDLTRVTGVQFFLINTDRPRVLHLDNLRLK